jgi:hypothetical protein
MLVPQTLSPKLSCTFLLNITDYLKYIITQTLS